MRVKIQSKLMTVVIGLIGFVFLAGVVVKGQGGSTSPSSPQRGTGSPGIYGASGIDTVNLTNGNLMINLPLASLPPSRGGLSNGLALVYNSKLYDTFVGEASNGAGGVCEQRLLKPGVEAGWQYRNANSYQMRLVSRLNEEGPNPGAPCTAEYQKRAYIWKLLIIFPDGSSHEMRPTGFADYFNDGYYNISPNGWQFGTNCTTVGGGTCSCTTGSVPFTTGPMVYYSTDGTFMRLVVDHNSNPSDQVGQDNTWTLYFPDGGKVVKTAQSTRAYDRNGNGVPNLTDEFGRSISITYNGALDEDTITKLGFENEILTWKVKWKTISVNQNYRTNGYTGGIGQNCTSTQNYDGDWRVVDRVTLPTQLGGLTYQFVYDVETAIGAAGWGELVKITMPTGAEVQYSYTPQMGGLPLLVDSVLKRYPNQKTVTYLSEYDGTSTPVSETTTYQIGTTSAYVTGANGSLQQQVFGSTAVSSRENGLIYKVINPDGTFIESLQAWNYPVGVQTSKNANNFIKSEFRTIVDNAGNPTHTAITDYNYDKNGNLTRVKEYGFVLYSDVPRDANGRPTGIPGSAQLIRETVNEYWTTAPDASDTTTNGSNCYWNSSAPANVRTLKATELKDGAGNTVSRSEMVYDNPLTTGNVTQARVWDSTKGAWSIPLTTANSNLVQAQYDQYGNPTLITDPRGTQTQIEYGPVGPNSVTGLYPTGKRDAYQTSLQRYETIGYDFATGLPIWTEDKDNQVLTTMDYDAIGRQTEQVAAANTSKASKSITEYNDAARRVVVRSNIDTFGDNRSVSVVHYDQLGRERLKRTLENPLDAVANETLGIKVQTRYVTDSGTPRNGTYQVVSNPYRAATSVQATAEAMGWSVSYSDKTGRLIWAKTYSGTAVPALSPAGSTVNLTGTVSTSYDVSTSGAIGQFTTVTDQSGKVRRSITDALGRLTRVDEPNTSNQLGTVAAPNQATSYVYDIRDNLIQVNQGVQTRSFVYDSLSRLTSATAPESGTTSYTYDSGGNLVTKTDARGVVVTNTYDALNRPTQRSYALTGNVGPTSTAQYFYDGAGLTGITANFAKGQLTKVTNGSASYEYRDFDALGRVLSARQIIDGNNYDTSYTYNLAGGLVTETYPSGRTVTNTFAADGDLSLVSGRSPGSAIRTYASNFEYAAHGPATKFQYGSGLWEERAFNTRLQVTDITLRKQASPLWNIAYDYGTTDNNNNVKSQSLLHPGILQPLVQAYGYDSLNRLTQVVETQNSVEQWKQTFSYDRYGNRTVITGQTTPAMIGPNPVINQANNRIAPQQNESYAYDAAGNLTVDQTGRRFTFDGENKVVAFYSTPSSQTPTAEYRYDVGGKRVKKIVGNVTTLFVYDVMGKMIGEYTLNAPQPGARTQYLTTDNVSSQRVISDGQGTVTSRRDFAPFGEDLPSNAANRQTGQGYQAGTDRTKQKFATYERDDETGLDFAQARYYASNLARFSASDPLLESAKPKLPQSWNRYIYVWDNPLRYLDDNGMEVKSIKLVIDGPNKVPTKGTPSKLGIDRDRKKLTWNIVAEVTDDDSPENYEPYEDFFFKNKGVNGVKSLDPNPAFIRKGPVPPNQLSLLTVLDGAQRVNGNQLVWVGQITTSNYRRNMTGILVLYFRVSATQKDKKNGKATNIILYLAITVNVVNGEIVNETGAGLQTQIEQITQEEYEARTGIRPWRLIPKKKKEDPPKPSSSTPSPPTPSPSTPPPN